MGLDFFFWIFLFLKKVEEHNNRMDQIKGYACGIEVMEWKKVIYVYIEKE
jgi:hypothetical protein